MRLVAVEADDAHLLTEGGRRGWQLGSAAARLARGAACSSLQRLELHCLHLLVKSLEMARLGRRALLLFREATAPAAPAAPTAPAASATSLLWL